MSGDPGEDLHRLQVVLGSATPYRTLHSRSNNAQRTIWQGRHARPNNPLSCAVAMRETHRQGAKNKDKVGAPRSAYHNVERHHNSRYSLDPEATTDHSPHPLCEHKRKDITTLLSPGTEKRDTARRITTVNEPRQPLSQLSTGWAEGKTTKERQLRLDHPVTWLVIRGCESCSACTK